MSRRGSMQEQKRGFSQQRAIRNFMVVSALYMSVPPLQAARPVALRGVTFSQIDLNRDGYIERNEAASRPEFAALLLSADLNHDGRLSLAEFEAAQGAEQTLKVKRVK